MAEIAFTKADSGPNYKTYAWTGATNGGTPDTFSAIRLEQTPYSIHIQAVGTFGASAAVALHGSLDGVNYFVIEKFDGTEISLDAAGIAGARDAVLFAKPVLTAGDGSTDITVTVLFRYA